VVAAIPRTAPLPLEGGDVALLNAEAVRGALHVRSWRPGDRYRPLGAPGTRKIQDIFVDAGVPRRLRAHILVILDEENIVWLAGFRVAERVKMLPDTTAILRIHIDWELNPWTLKRFDVE
jgi:tRNA(Ile)-lysidine synthase